MLLLLLLLLPLARLFVCCMYPAAAGVGWLRNTQRYFNSCKYSRYGLA
jgi:hypothetical protein